jgi:hypothetical protein
VRWTNKNIQLSSFEKILVMRLFRQLATLFLLIAVSLGAYAEEASFRCKNARTDVEQRICQSPYATLKNMDRDLAKWYRRALGASANAQGLRDDQRHWLESLNDCLTTELVEPKPYVCDAVPESNGKGQCFRDFCLVAKYIERSRYLYALPTKGSPGRYVLSDRWPSGIHESVVFMAPDNRGLCKSVEATLSALGPLSGALTQKKPFSETSDRTRVSWVPIEKSQLFPTAKKLEKLLRWKWQHDTTVVESDAFSQQLVKRIASGEITISRASALTFGAGLTKAENKEISVLRYQRWTDETKLTDYDFYEGVELFRVDHDDLSTVQSVGSAADAFLFNGLVYFDSISERTFDDRWRLLPIPQPELYIYTAQMENADNIAFRTACHLLYVQGVGR